MPFDTMHPPQETAALMRCFSDQGVRLRRVLRTLWRGLREWCGDAAYERYSSAQGTKTCVSPKMTPAEFYVDQLNRRYSRPNRCC